MAAEQIFQIFSRRNFFLFFFFKFLRHSNWFTGFKLHCKLSRCPNVNWWPDDGQVRLGRRPESDWPHRAPASRLSVFTELAAAACRFGWALLPLLSIHWWRDRPPESVKQGGGGTKMVEMCGTERNVSRAARSAANQIAADTTCDIPSIVFEELRPSLFSLRHTRRGQSFERKKNCFAYSQIEWVVNNISIFRIKLIWMT